MVDFLWSERVAAEAACVAGIEERDINRLVDEKILPESDRFKIGKSRKFGLADCVLSSFYFRMRELLEKPALAMVMETVYLRLAAINENPPPQIDQVDWSVQLNEYVKIDIRLIAAKVAERMSLLNRAEQLVHADAEVLGGTPVFKGTRVPVKTIADWVESKETEESILQSFPRVSEEMVALAPLWAKAHQPKGSKNNEF